jgi:lipopolysaccharide biosynthesis glycosyltransferase
MSAPPPGPPRIDPRYVAAWSRLASIALGRSVSADPARMVPPANPSVLEQVRTSSAHAEFSRQLTSGASLERATYRGVVALTAAQDPDAAWALTEAVRRLPSGHTAALVGLIALRHRQAQFEQVWELAADLDDDVLAAHLAVEVIDGALASKRDDARTRAAAIVSTPQRFDDVVLVDLAGRFLVAGERGPAEALMADLRRRPTPKLSDRARASARHIEATLARAPKPVPAGAVPFAILDYQSPDQHAASNNLGDYIQTLALVGNLARFSDVRFTGEDGLGQLAGELQQQVRADLRIDDQPENRTRAVHLLDVNREFSNGDAVPPQTWTIAFGWHMHPLYRRFCDFPYHRNLRPIFVAFHVNHMAMLDDAAVAYLREYAPIGCRDHTTVNLLLSRGVDAFFTGCLTPTIDAIFPELADVNDGEGPVGVIDLPRAAAGPGADDAVVLSHAVDEYREMTLVEAMRTARALMAERQGLFSRVVTSRLHAYLPFVALGVPVEFRPHRPGDVRFPGLTGLTPGSPPLQRMQSSVRELLAEIFGLIVDGADETDVYARWRELTADRTERARARFAAVSEPPAPSIDLAQTVETCRAAARRYRPASRNGSSGDAVDVALWVDADRTDAAAVLIASILANTSAPVRAWLLTRGVTPDFDQRLVAMFRDTAITVLPLDHVVPPPRVQPADADRLLLPELLTDLDRVVYLDVASLVLGDLAELARLDLAGHPLAARDSYLAANREWRRIASPLPQRRASEWLRSMIAGQPFNDPALDDAVLVLDLQRLRADGFSATWLAWAEQYGLETGLALLGYAGADRYRLDPRWNAALLRDDIADPAIVHWAGTAMPWDPVLTPSQDLWREIAARSTSPGTTGPGHRLPGGLILATSGRSDGS